MIKFKTVRYRNFLSSGNVFTVVELDKARTTLIIGSNGKGKSTVIDAICFALFGKTYRKINKSSIINSINEKDCVVEIEFETNGSQYKIIRGIKPNIFEIYQDGKLLNQDAKSLDYQAILEKNILRMNYKSFTQIDILGSAAFTPFMQLSAGDRRTVIEDLLDIQVFSTMNILVKQKLQANKDAIASNKLEMSSLSDKIEYLDKTIKSLKTIDVGRIKKLKEELKDLEFEHLANISKKTSLEDDLSELISNSTLSSELKSKHSKLLTIKSKIESNKNRANKEIMFYSDNDECPTCKQKIDKGFKGKIIHETETQIHLMDDGISDLDTKINDLLNSIEESDKVMAQIQSINSEIKALDSKDEFLVTSIKRLKSTLGSELDSNDLILDNEKQLKDSKLKIKYLVSDQKKLLEEKQYLELSLTILKDGGIKSQIIKQYLPLINKQINKYLKSLDFMVEFFLDEEFKETIKSRYRDVFSYENFSQGEKARIDLAILFTWRYIAKLRNSVSTNLLIMDEVFDQSIDSVGQDDLMKILAESDKDTHTFVISHTKEHLADKFDNVLRFEKQKGFSVLTEGK